MPKFFVDRESIIDVNNIVIKGEDVNHIKKVLRMNIGDNITVCNKDASENFFCEIEEFKDDSIVCKVINKLDSEAESNLCITIFQGLPKADKMELIIQKSTELGVANIVPTVMKRCVVKIEKKDEIKKQTRWQKIAEVAAKQSGRDVVPIVKDFMEITEICSIINNYDLVLVAYENEENNSIRNEIEKIKKETMKNLKVRFNYRTGRWFRDI